ncbi:MAG TPA: FecR domain-containing protein [Puia sp.]|nr:FecR domain-containing protein [Puia sp.]
MVNDRFIRLLTKELCDELTDAEREELTLLLQSNKEYRDQKELLKEYWEKDRADYESNAVLFKKVTDKIKAEELIAAPAEGRGGRISRTVWYSAAAAILLTIGLFLYHFHSAGTDKKILAIHWLQKITQPAKKSSITLSDGTVVTLNAATTLKYPDRFGDSTREIYLDGEAYFDVAKDARHPFIIHANKMNIRVLGTSFNVKSYQNEWLSEATLIKGSIEVTLNDRPSDRFILKPKEKLIIQNNAAIKRRMNTDSIRSIPDSAGKGTRYALTNLTYFPNSVKTVIETSWVENKLVFSDKDFAQLSGQLERWYGVHIEFGNDQVKEYRFTGFFEKESLSQALDVLKMIEHFNYKISDSIVYIY